MAEAKIRLSVDGAAIAKSEIDKVNASLSGLGGGADIAKRALAGLAGTITAGAFISMIRGSIDAADKLNDLSKSTGLAVETLSGLKLASKQSGADLDGTAASINKLSVNIGKNAEKFAALGVTAKDPLEAFKQLSDVFKNIDDPQLRAAVGAEALGKSWASAAPLLMEGGAEIQKMVDKGSKLSGVNQEMTTNADKLNDNWALLVGTGGAINRQVAAMLPILVAVSDEFVKGGEKAGDASKNFTVLAEAMRGISLVGASVAHAFNIGGIAIGGFAAQMASMKMNGSNVAEIGKMMRADIAQANAEFTALGMNIINAGKNNKGYVKDLFASSGDNARVNANASAAAANNAAARAFVTTPKDAKAEKISEYTRMAEAIGKVTAMQEQELAYGGKLTASDKFRVDELQKINFALQTKKINQAESLKLIAMTTLATAKMAEVERQAYITDAIKKNTEAVDKQYTALAQTLEGMIAANEQQRLENETIGLTTSALDALTLSRIDATIAAKQQEVVNAQSLGTDAATIGLMEREIALMQTKRALTNAGQTSKAEVEAKKLAEETAKKYESEQVAIWNQIDSTAESVFMDIAKNGTSAFKHLEDELKNGLLKLLYEMTVKKWIISIGSDMTGLDLGSLMGGSSGGNPLMKLGTDLLSKGASYLFGGGAAASASTAASTFGVATGTAGTYGMSAAAGTGAAALAELSTGVATLGASATAATGATVAAGGGLAGLGNAALAALGPVGLLAAGAIALFAIFGFGKEKIPTVLNDLSLFNNSLIGLPFLELSLGSDDAAQGLRDVLYGLDNATPAMRKLAGDTVSLSIDLLRASGDIAGARNLARNIGTRGMSEEEIAVYDYNEKLRDQIEAHREAAAAASAGASAAQAAKQAEDQLAQTRWNLAGKLNILLGRTTQLEFDRATALAATTDEASIAMLKLTYQLEDLYTAVDANFAKLERSIAAEKKIADVRLKSATELQTALKTAYDAVAPSLDRASAQAQISMYLALAKAGGVLPTAAMLKPALDAIAKPSTDLFKTFSEYAIDQARTANDISDLSDYADKQVSAEQQTLDRLDLQLDNAKQALDVLKGVDTSITTAAAADAAFYASMLALTAAKASAASYAYTAPAATATSGGGGGGGGSYSGGAASAASNSAATAGMDEDIVAAYNAYYGRNPDPEGYEHFAALNLTGSAMMQAILHASNANKAGADYAYAVAHGYDPENPLLKFYHGKKKYKATESSLVEGSFAVGTNFLERDAVIQAHRGEEIKPRPFVDIDRAAREETNALLRRLTETNESQRQEIAAMRLDIAQVRTTNKEMKDIIVKSDAIGPAPSRAML